MGCGASNENQPPGHSDNRPTAGPQSNDDGDNNQEGGAQTKGKDGKMPLHERFGYPAPFPPKTTKDDIFDVSKFESIDKHASKVPKEELRKSFRDVAMYVIKDVKTDLEKVRAIFKFVTSLDIPGLADDDSDAPPPGTALDYLLKIHFQMGNHAHFFAQLCRAAALSCLVLTGVNKSAAYQLGGNVDRESMGAQWNAVLVDEQWRLVDVYWASTCVVGKKSGDWDLVDVDGEVVDADDEEDGEGDIVVTSNEFFFLTDPEKLVCTHLPDEPEWQLMEKPWTETQFAEYVYIRERYWDLHLSMNAQSHTLCKYKTQKGEARLSFTLPPNESAKHQYRYLLFRSRQRGGDKAPSVPFERFVFFQKKADQIMYNATFPLAGTFKLDVFGQHVDDHETFDLVASYLIDCPDPRSNAQPLPDCPDIGWGPGADSEGAGLKAKSHEDAIIDTDDGEVEIRFGMAAAKHVLQNLKSNQLDDWLLSRHAIIREDNGELVITMRLPKEGEYALKLFADDTKNTGDMPNVCNYLIRCLNSKVKGKPYPKLHEGMLGKGLGADEVGIKAKSHQEGIITTPDGKLSTVFECSNPDYELLCEVHHNDMDKGALGKGIATSVDGKDTTFDIELPNAGEYGMNVYAKKKGTNKLVHVHTYLVKSLQESGENLPPPKGDPPIIQVAMSSDEAEVRLPGGDGKKPLVAEIQRKNATDDPHVANLTASVDGKEEVFKIKLTEMGEYKMDVYEERENGALEHLCTYQIIRHEPLPEEQQQQAPAAALSPEEEAKAKKEKEAEKKYRVYREQLRAAMQAQDPYLLAQAIKDCEANGVPEKKGDIGKAKQLLEYLTIQQDLTSAMSSRNLKKLEKAVEKANKSSVKKKLNVQIQMAERVLEQLRKIEKLRHAILNLDQKTIAEIKSYKEPPPAVHTVMATTFLLLGDPEKLLKEWKSVQVLIGKTGKEGLKRRIGEFNVEKLAKNIELALKAQKKQKDFSLNDVRDVSAGAATFYVWTSGMIEEAISQFEQDGGDLEEVKSRKKSAKKK